MSEYPIQRASSEGDGDLDLEKNKADINVSSDANSDEHQQHSGPFGVHDSVNRTGKLWKFADKLSKYGVEQRGIERILPEERSQTLSPWSCFWMWLAANCTISTFALGTLGTSIWYMGVKDAFLTIVFTNLAANLIVAYFSTFGPKTGMRQLTLTRFSFGYYVCMIPALLNALACIGWSTVNAIVGGQALRAVAIDSNLPKMPIEVAIIIIAVLTFAFSFMGYKFVHLYEKYSWIPVAIIFLVYAGLIGKHVDIESGWAGTGRAEAASVLSFMSAIVGFSFGWSSLAADYSCNLPETTSTYKVFGLTYLGLIIPQIGLELLGAAAMATFTSMPTWGEHFETEGVGGLIAAPLVHYMHGGGRFFSIIAGLSIVANNIPNLYSFSLTVQNLGPWVQRIPRPFLVVLATAIYIVLACVGAHRFEEALDTLLLVLAYWLSIVVVIVVEEHFIFRGGDFKNWNLEDVHNPRKLPFGAAAFASLCLGWVGAVLFMSQVWFVGPGAIAVGGAPFGADIGFEMSAAFAGISFPLFRYIEKKYWGY
jgi:NCS1 nucleoside transporter family